MNLSYRRLAEKDLPSIAVSLARFLRNLNYFARLETETPADTEARVSQHLALCLADGSHSVYVAQEQSGEVQGYLSVHWIPYLFLPGPEGFVSELFVSPAARGKGVGGRLLDGATAEARQRGCARLSLLNMRGRESYQRGFYSKHGWEERPEAANFILTLAPGELSPASFIPNPPGEKGCIMP